jgi:hypothetical protein
VRIFGWVLALVGGLWVLLSGGCTLAFLVGGLAGGGGSGDLQLAMTFAAIGAVCILPGAGLLYGGWTILRKRKG